MPYKVNQRAKDLARAAVAGGAAGTAAQLAGMRKSKKPAVPSSASIKSLSAGVGRDVMNGARNVGNVARGVGEIIGGAATVGASPMTGRAVKSVADYGIDLVKRGGKRIGNTVRRPK